MRKKRAAAAVPAVILLLASAGAEEAFRDAAAGLVIAHNSYLASLGADGARIDAAAPVDAGEDAAAFFSIDRKTIFSFVPASSGDRVAEVWVMTGDAEAFAASVLMSTAGFLGEYVSEGEAEEAGPVLEGMIADCLLTEDGGEYGRRIDVGPVAVQVFCVPVGEEDARMYMLELLLLPREDAPQAR